MDDRLAFLRACLDDDERVALKAKRLKWDHPDDAPWRRAQIMLDRNLPDRTAQLIATFANPDDVLAEIDTKRRILDLHGIYADAQFPDYKGGYSSAMDDVVRLLVLRYADRPGYREEWGRD